MGICPTCFTIINATSLVSHSDDHQKAASQDFYEVDENLKREAAQQTYWRRDLLEFAYAQIPDLERRVFVDVGAGLGFMAAAGALDFERAYAVEINRSGIDELQPYFPRFDNLTTVDYISDINDEIDLVTLWHVIEHLPDAIGFLSKIALQLSSNGHIFFQVPMFNPNHVFDTHYSFLSEETCKYIANNLGLHLRGVWYDTRHDFLAVIMSKRAVTSRPEIGIHE